MSHYITASFGKNGVEGTELSGGVSWHTLSALEESGIDVYELYQGSEHHAGMSGGGSDVTVKPEHCEKAYQHTIAWVMAMKARYPEAYHEEYAIKDPSFPETPPLAEDHTQILVHHPFDATEIKALYDELYADLEKYPLSEYHLDRSMSYLHLVLQFAKNIYDFTSKTNDIVVIGFY